MRLQSGELGESSMRKLLTSLGLCVVFGSAAPLLAESPEPSVYEKDAALSTSRHMTAAEQRIYERASLEARERLARIESRHRSGISMQRPAVSSPNLFATETLWNSPWRGYRYYPGPFACPCP
jgi:hypothetical protein